MAEQVTTLQLTLYMVNAKSSGWGLHASTEQYERVPLQPITGLDVRLLISQSEPAHPRWLKDLLAVAADGSSLRELTNRHSTALLLISYHGHRFILAYGRGWQAIDRSCVEPRFGLQVVANAVAVNEVKSVDTRALGGRHLSQRTAMPTAGPLYELGIEPTNTLVRQLEGRPSPGFANAAVGNDSLRLKVSDFSLKSLREKLDQVIALYESEAYKQNYGFLDYYRPVRNNPIREELHKMVIGLIGNRRSDLVSFAPPDLREPLSVDHYIIRRGQQASSMLPELTAESVSSAIANWSVDDPLALHVEAYDVAGELVGGKLRLGEYVVTEVSLNERTYVAAEGSWHEVDTGFMAELQQGIAAIPDLTNELDLPAWDPAEFPKEGDYNNDLAKRGWKVLDGKNFPIERRHQKVEICDLLTPEKQLLCVKRMDRSSTLSHLFNQGWVSWQLLVDNAEGYQDQVMKYLTEIRPGAEFGGNHEWSVVYCIATSQQAPLAECLFFFSKVALYRASQWLRRTGVKVALAKISMPA